MACRAAWVPLTGAGASRLAAQTPPGFGDPPRHAASGLVEWPLKYDAHSWPKSDDRRTLRPTGRGEYGYNRVQTIVSGTVHPTRHEPREGCWHQNIDDVHSGLIRLIRIGELPLQLRRNWSPSEVAQEQRSPSGATTGRVQYGYNRVQEIVSDTDLP